MIPGNKVFSGEHGSRSPKRKHARAGHPFPDHLFDDISNCLKTGILPKLSTN